MSSKSINSQRANGSDIIRCYIEDENRKTDIYDMKKRRAGKTPKDKYF
jgi:hypothetical protein